MPFDQLKRREFITLLGGAAAMAQAQQTAPATPFIPKPASAVGSDSGPQRQRQNSAHAEHACADARRAPHHRHADRGRLEAVGVIDGRRADTCT